MPQFTLINFLWHFPNNPKYIDFILTNKHFPFQNSSTIETRLLDFHSLIVTVLKGGFIKRGLKIVMYRDCSQFDVNDFRRALKGSLDEMDSSDIAFSEFNGRVETVLNEHAPLKKRNNDGPFMRKALRKAINIPVQTFVIYILRTEAKKTRML